MTTYRASLVPLTLIGSLLAAAPPAVPVAWDSLPPLAADPSALLLASSAIPATEDAGIQDFLEETSVTIDEAGRKESRYRYVFRVDQEASVESWREVAVSWSPWHEARPEIRARVITPDGHAHDLDQKTVGEYATESGNNGVYSDQKTLRAPLPQLAKGVIAEVVIIRKETSPFSRTGVTGGLGLWQPFPVHRTRIDITAPASAPLRWKVYGMPGTTLTKASEGGKVHLSLELGPLPAYKQPESHLPSSEGEAPGIGYSTSPSWQAAATEYAKILELQLKDADLGAWVAEATRGASTRDQKIAAILAHLHKSVRYTGIEFGDRAIVPATPAETLRRGFGDCKDKATVLACALRAAGIPADVALLQAGTGVDTDPDLPGLGGFNHAIVHVPGDAPMWIDATADSAPFGSTYLGVEGRMALIAAPSTTSLSRIPEMASKENNETETREVFFGDEAPGRILETTDTKGYFEQNLRSDYTSTDGKKLHDILESYAKDSFKAKSLGKFSYTDPLDFSKPFQLKLEANEAGSVQEDSDNAWIPVNAWPLVSDLVSDLGGLPDPKKGGEDRRKGSLLLPRPYTRDLRYIIHCPDGYTPGTLPASKERTFGPATFTQTYASKADGTVMVSFHVDTGKRLWTSSEVAAARDALKQYGDEDISQVIFNQVGEAYLQAGKAKEAIEEFQRLSKSQPGKASPLLHYANALLAAGLGEEARAQALRAVELEPQSVRTHRSLAWVYQHDLVGRRFGKGWDPEAAVREYRKAKALDPKDYATRGNLAILLESCPDGVRYNPKADLAAAVLEYQGIRKDLDNHQLDLNLLIDLAKLGRFSEALDLAQSMPSGSARNGWMVVALVADKGLEAGLQEAGRLIPNTPTRRAALVAAADQLLRLRKYPEAARLLQDGSEGSDQMAHDRMRAEILARTRPFDTVLPDPKDPRGVVRQLLTAVILGRGSKEVLPLLSPALTREDGFEKNLTEELQRGEKDLAGTDLPREVILDLTLSHAQIAADGDDTKGYRVNVRGLDGNTQTYFVAHMDEGYRLVGISAAAPYLGFQALWCLDHGQADQARGWLDQARDLIAAPPSDDPVRGAPFARLWTKGQSADAERIRLAATVLASVSGPNPHLLKALVDTRSKTTEPKDALALDIAIAASAREGEQWSQLIAATERILKAAPDSPTAVSLRFWGFMASDQAAEGVQFGQTRLAKHPDDTDLQGGFYYALGLVGQRDAMEKGIQALIDKGRATASDYNNLAWSQVTRGAVTENTLELIRIATQNGGSSSSLHTLAVVLADLGRTTEAKAALLKEMDAQKLGEPGGNEWYVLGRIAEQLDIPEAALACYARVKPKKASDAKDPGSCASLAAKRVAALKASKGH